MTSKFIGGGSHNERGVSAQKKKSTASNASAMKKMKASQQQSHPSQLFIQKLIKKLHLPKFLRISCPLKMLLKYINACYNALITINR